MSSAEKPDSSPSLKWMWANVFRKEDASEVSIRASMKKIPLFHDLTQKELRRVEESLYLRRYRQNEFVFREGEPGLGMYIIHSGSVWIQRTGNPGTEGLQPLLELGPGDFFGEMALLEEHVRLVSAKAHATSELLGFFRPDFLTLAHYHPRLGCKLLLALGRVIASRFRASLTDSEGG